MRKAYIPVGCEIVDQIEIAATKKRSIWIVYETTNGGTIIQINTKIKTWKTKSKEEFLVTLSGLEIRLDQILSIGDHRNEGYCGI